MQHRYRCLTAIFIALSASAIPFVHAQMVWNHAANFDSTGYIAIPHSASLNITGSFTLEAWVNTTSSAPVTIVGDNEYRLLLASGRGRVQMNNTTFLDGTIPINDGKWNHIACVFDSAASTLAFYVNGTLDTSGPVNTVPWSGTDSIIVGKSIYGHAPEMLDEVRIWNTALPPSTIAADRFTSLAGGTGLYANLVLSVTFQSLNNAPPALDLTDKSGNANNGFNRGATLVDMSGVPSSYLIPNQSLFLDGVSGYAVAGSNASLPTLGPFTIEAWIYPLNAATGNQQTIVSREASGLVGYEIYLTGTGRLGVTTMGTRDTSSRLIMGGRWTHVAVTYTYDGSVALAQMFINGIRDTSFSSSPIANTADSVCIGRSAALTNYFSGYIDEVRFSGYVKTADDLRRGLFTSIDYRNRRSQSNLELVYGFDGSTHPTTYAAPALTLRGSGAKFSSLVSGSGVPVSPLTRDTGSPGSFPDGYYLKTAAKRVPATGINAGSIEDTINVAPSVTINNLKVFVAFNHGNESALQCTLFSPSGDSATLWYFDFQSDYTSGAATIFNDMADSAMNHRYLSFTPMVRPHSPINSAFAGKNSAGAWRLRMTQLVNGFSGMLYGWGLEFNNQTLADVSQQSPAVPGPYELFPAFPDPFNPTAVIRYQVPSPSHVRIVVYNSIGQHVATLIDGEVSEGVHQTVFDGSRLSSGVYFYRMAAGRYVQTRKVVLVK